MLTVPLDIQSRRGGGMNDQHQTAIWIQEGDILWLALLGVGRLGPVGSGVYKLAHVSQDIVFLVIGYRAGGLVDSHYPTTVFAATVLRTGIFIEGNIPQEQTLAPV